MIPADRSIGVPKGASVRAAAAGCLVFLLFLDTPWHAQERVFRSNVDGVTIGVSVRSNNRPVPGLTAEDFELTDNGVRQELSTIAPEQLPVDLTLLLDLSSSVDGPLLQRLKTAVADTAALLRGDDRIRLVAVSQVLREVFGFRPRNSVLPLDTLAAEGATSLYDGLAATMMRATEPGRRQLVVAFTDGRDSTSIIDEATARDVARQTDAVVDIVVPIADAAVDRGARRLSQRNGGIDALPGGNLSGARIAPGAGGDQAFPPVLAELVSPTAGQVFPLEPAASVSHAFKAMLDDFRASYVLQYVPKAVAAGGWHEVAVTVRKHAKYEVRARKGYTGRSTISPSEVMR